MALSLILVPRSPGESRREERGSSYLSWAEILDELDEFPIMVAGLCKLIQKNASSACCRDGTGTDRS